MDIEGAELSALKGAKHLIRYDRPICAICIYHKADDLWNIKNYLGKYIGKCKWYLRHYSDNQTETVLYAI